MGKQVTFTTGFLSAAALALVVFVVGGFSSSQPEPVEPIVLESSIPAEPDPTPTPDPEPVAEPVEPPAPPPTPAPAPAPVLDDDDGADDDDVGDDDDDD